MSEEPDWSGGVGFGHSCGRSGEVGVETVLRQGSLLWNQSHHHPRCDHNPHAGHADHVECVDWSGFAGEGGWGVPEQFHGCHGGAHG